MATRARGGRGPDIKDLPPFEGRVHKWIRKQVPVPRAAKSLDNTHKLELLRWCLQSDRSSDLRAPRHPNIVAVRAARAHAYPTPTPLCLPPPPPPLSQQDRALLQSLEAQHAQRSELVQRVQAQAAAALLQPGGTQPNATQTAAPLPPAAAAIQPQAPTPSAPPPAAAAAVVPAPAQQHAVLSPPLQHPAPAATPLPPLLPLPPIPAGPPRAPTPPTPQPPPSLTAQAQHAGSPQAHAPAWGMTPAAAGGRAKEVASGQQEQHQHQQGQAGTLASAAAAAALATAPEDTPPAPAPSSTTPSAAGQDSGVQDAAPMDTA